MGWKRHALYFTFAWWCLFGMQYSPSHSKNILHNNYSITDDNNLPSWKDLWECPVQAATFVRYPELFGQTAWGTATTILCEGKGEVSVGRMIKSVRNREKIYKGRNSSANEWDVWVLWGWKLSKNVWYDCLCVWPWQWKKCAERSFRGTWMNV